MSRRPAQSVINIKALTNGQKSWMTQVNILLDGKSVLKLRYCNYCFFPSMQDISTGKMQDGISLLGV